MKGLIARVHNPSRLRCGCPPDCICQRNKLGRLLRWYIPGRHHTPIRPEDKEQLYREGRSFREA